MNVIVRDSLFSANYLQLFDLFKATLYMSGCTISLYPIDPSHHDTQFPMLSTYQVTFDLPDEDLLLAHTDDTDITFEAIKGSLSTRGD